VRRVDNRSDPPAGPTAMVSPRPREYVAHRARAIARVWSRQGNTMSRTPSKTGRAPADSRIRLHMPPHSLLVACALSMALANAQGATSASPHEVFDTYVVTTTADSGPGSLRDALLTATPGRVITFAVSGTITLTSPLPPIRVALSITGPGVASLTISGADAYRVLFVDAAGATVTISDVDIAHGLARGGKGGDGLYGGGGGLGAGGGLFVNSGTVVLSHVDFHDNAATGGNGGSFSGGFNGGGGGGGLGGNGGAGYNYSGGGGGGYYGNGGSATSNGGGGGGGVSGNGGAGGNNGGGGGGAWSNGQDASGTVGGAGADGLGGQGGTGTGGLGNSAGSAGQVFGGGGGGGYGHSTSGYFGGDGGAGGTYGGGGGADHEGSGGDGGDFGGGGGFLPQNGTFAIGDGGGDGGFGGGGGGGSALNCDITGCRNRSGDGGFGACAGAAAYGGLPMLGTSGPFAGAPGAGVTTGNAPAGSGGGAALGAALFVRGDNGASLTWADGSVDVGALTPGVPGSGGVGATAGSTRGTSMFLLGGTTTVSVTSGRQTVDGSIGGWTGSLPNLVKGGDGTLALASTDNVDLGTFEIAQGQLAVDGMLPAAVTIDSGATLGGNGMVAGAVTLHDGGRLEPGDPAINGGIGRLDIGGLTWEVGATMAFQLGASAAASDHLAMTGNLVTNGTGLQFQFTDGASAPVCGTQYPLLDTTGFILPVPDDFTYVYSGANAGLTSHGMILMDAFSTTLTFLPLCDQAITNFIATPANPVYSPAGTFGVSATPGASNSPVQFLSTSTDICTTNDATVSILSAGDCELTAYQGSDGTYAAAQATMTVSIARAEQAITNFTSTPAAPLFHPGGTFSVSATMGASGNPLTFASTTTGVCTVAGSTVTMLAPGTCTLTADEAGDTNYNDAPTVTLDVVPTRRTVTAVAATSGGTIAPPTQQVTDGDIASFTVTADAGHAATVTGDTCTVTSMGGGLWQTTAIHGDCHVTSAFDDRIFASGFEGS